MCVCVFGLVQRQTAEIKALWIMMIAHVVGLACTLCLSLSSTWQISESKQLETTQWAQKCDVVVHGIDGRVVACVYVCTEGYVCSYVCVWLCLCVRVYGGVCVFVCVRVGVYVCQQLFRVTLLSTSRVDMPSRSSRAKNGSLAKRMRGSAS